MTAHKVMDQRRHDSRKKRGAGQVRGDSAFKDHLRDDSQKGFDQLIGAEPTPEFLAMLAEEHQRLMGQLENDTLRQIAQWKMDGYENEEIADRLGLTRRSVERKLQWIRQIWAAKLEL